VTFRATEDGLLFRVEETGTDYRILEGPHFQVGAGQLAGTGNLTVGGALPVRVSGAILFAGAGLLRANTNSPIGVEDGSFILTGASSLSVALRALERAAATLIGAGALTGPLRAAEQLRATFAGAGSLVVQSRRFAPAETAFAGTGALAAQGFTFDYGRVQWSGSGFLSTGGGGPLPAAAALFGAGLLTAGLAILKPPVTIALAGTGGLAVTVDRRTLARTGLVGAGALSVADPMRVSPAAAEFAGAGLLAGPLAVSLPAAAAFAGTGDLQAAAGILLPTAIGLVGEGQLGAGLDTYRWAGALLVGTGNLFAVPAPVPGIGVFAGRGALIVQTKPFRRAAAEFLGAGGLVVNAVRVLRDQAGLVGTGAIVLRATHTVYVLPTRTNWVRNNTNVGAGAGSPGALPDFWSEPDQFTGLNRTITLGISPEGYPITRIRYQGVVVGGNTNVRVTEADSYLRRYDETGGKERIGEGPQGVAAIGGAVAFEMPTAIPANDGETWAHSLKVALVATSPNLLGAKLETWLLNPGGNQTGTLAVTDLRLTRDLQRFSQVATILPATHVAFIRPVLRFTFLIGPVDFTFEVAGAQVERNYVTDIIQTGGSAVSIGPDLWYRGDGVFRVAEFQRGRIAAALRGQGDLQVPLVLPRSGRVAWAGAGQLRAQAVRTRPGLLYFDGEGDLYVQPPKFIWPTMAEFWGTGHLAVPRMVYPRAILTEMWGEGELTSRSRQPLTTSLIGEGDLWTGGVRAKPILAAFAGTGALEVPLAVGYPAKAVLRGSGMLAGPLAVARPLVANFVGAGQLRVQTVRDLSARVHLAGAGVLRVAPVERALIGTWLTGQGDLSTRGRVRLPTAAHLVGIGSLVSVSRETRVPITAWLRGAGRLTGYERVSPGLGAWLDGRGALSAPMVQVSRIGLWWRGAGQLAGPLARTQLIRVHFQGLGKLIPRIERAPQYGAALLFGDGKLSVRGRQILPLRAAFHGQGELLAGTTHLPRSSLAGRGALTVTVAERRPMRVRFAGTGALRVEARPDRQAITARLVGHGALAVRVRGDPAISAALRGAGALRWQAAQINLTFSRFHGEGRLVARAPRFRPISAELRGTGAFWADPIVREWIYEPPLILYPPFRVRLLRATSKVA
jgi:hypothetical protein